jgi:hypothetical protein
MPTDPRRLETVRRWARVFDSAFRIPGTQIRFGLDPILGLFPGLGDVVSPIFSVVLLWHGARLRVPKIVLARMAFNALIDVAVGVIPGLGDLFDFAWKANTWNLALIEKHALPGQRATSWDYVFVILCSLVVAAAALVPILLVWSLLSWIDRQFF